jgi:hypothetical protein
VSLLDRIEALEAGLPLPDNAEPVMVRCQDAREGGPGLLPDALAVAVRIGSLLVARRDGEPVDELVRRAAALVPRGPGVRHVAFLQYREPADNVI